MRKGLLGSTALIGATALFAGAAGAAEAPTWKLTGNMNFQAYSVDQDLDVYAGGPTTDPIRIRNTPSGVYTEDLNVQDHGWYFGVDESELQLNVTGTADNGLNYGFKIEINANTTDDYVADEARLQLSGGWGTLQLGDEDGAEDVMNYGGENLMGATGGFDGDFDDVLLRATDAATSYPMIAGDTGDQTKVSYFSPRLAGFQVGASLTPTPNNGDEHPKVDGDWENHVGVGANYDNAFGGLRVGASAVYSTASSTDPLTEDVAAWSVGTIVGFGPVSVGGNYTDNGESGTIVGSGDESSYWNVAAGFEAGPLYLSAGYFVSTYEFGAGVEDEFSNVALTADYSIAAGLGVYAEVDLIEDDPAGTVGDNDATVVILGANASF